MKTKVTLAMGFALLLSACGGDPIQKDLLNYVNVELGKVSDLESEAIDAYEGVVGDNYKGDSIMYFTLKDTVIPKYEAFSSALESIKPATTEVMGMHQEYMKAAGEQMEAFKLLIIALEKQDAAIVQQANADLDLARTNIDKWKSDVREACKQHNVELTEGGDSN
ncbi:MAG: hypothetical protein JST14_13365 [Bacteroidetes bacterium]|nr:hypothetical protein [Bacteroidota bacterium]MBS1976771.1 hypothetical protein [Bacteroidota bacterium]